jgi:hypothetical protein
MTSADRDFLLKTSLTEMVNSELADQLTGRSDSRRVLEGLFESGVFTVDSDRIGVEHRPADRERSGLIYLLEEEHTALSGYPMPVTPPRFSLHKEIIRIKRRNDENHERRPHSIGRIVRTDRGIMLRNCWGIPPGK